MGLGALRTQWQRQYKDFGHLEADKYSCLIFDNRGVGRSDKPFCRYSTSEMAMDVKELADAVGWTGPRDLHVIGSSMGGMISQELGLLIPERIASLTLMSTAPRIFNTIGYIENMRNRINLLLPKSLDKQIAMVKENIFTPTWLQSPDDLECEVEPFPTNGDRAAAYELSKRSDPEALSRIGFLSQLLAGGYHHKTAAQIKDLGDKVGRERILLIHGTEDRMITFPHAEALLQELGGENGGIRWLRLEGQGHGVPAEMRKELKIWLEELIEKTQTLRP
jgi:pimeloyl-ACP methyl ester carboxylesterase